MHDEASSRNKFQRPKPDEPDHIACEVCLTEIPTSVAQSAEGGDYVHYFCGIDCLERWKEQERRDAGAALRPDR